MSELWKDIPGYEGLYQASTLGSVRSISTTVPVHSKRGIFYRQRKGCVLAPSFDGKKHYLHVNLTKDGKSKSVQVHRIIASTFIENPLGLPEVNHIDEDKTNNAVENLEWCDHSYNNNYGTKIGSTRGEKNPQNKFQEEIVREIKRSWISGDPQYGTTALAKKYNMSETHLSAIIHGRRWSWLE